MAIYTPRPASSRTRRGSRKPKWSERLRSIVPRRPAKPIPSYRPQALSSPIKRPALWQKWLTVGIVLVIVAAVAGAVLVVAGQWLLRSDIFRLAEIRITG